MNCPRPRGNELLLCSISYNIMPCITTIYKSICALSGPNLASSINSAAATNNYPVYNQQQTRKRSRGSARKGFRRNFFARNARVIKETMLHHSYLPLYSLSTASPFAVEGQKNSQIQIDAKTKLNKMWDRGAGRGVVRTGSKQISRVYCGSLFCSFSASFPNKFR